MGEVEARNMTWWVRARGSEGPWYAVTPDDVLWLRRAVQSEGEPREEVARALVHLHAQLRERNARWRESPLAELVRAYAQPVSPAWMHGGARDANPDVVSAAERRREEAVKRRSFDPAVLDAVEAAVTTSSRSVVTDYAAAHVDAAHKGYQLVRPGSRTVNALWLRWPDARGYESRWSTGEEPSRTAESEVDVVARQKAMAQAGAVRQMAVQLPSAERAAVLALVAALAARLGVHVGAVGSDGVREWDLAAANELQALYEAVSDRVVQLGGQAVAVATVAVERAAQGVARSSLTWLLLLAALTAVYLYGRR